MRAMPIINPNTRANAKASSETAIVSIAPCRSDGRNAMMSSSEKIMNATIRFCSIVVTGEPPFRQNLFHLVVVLHPLYRGGKSCHPLDITLAERVAAVTCRILEGARFVVIDQFDLPLRMVLHQGRDDRLVEQR